METNDRQLGRGDAGRPERMLRLSIGVSAGWLGISMVAEGVPALLLPHMVLTEGRADAAGRLGLITLIAIGIATLIQPVAGWVSDRVGRQAVIWTGSAIAAGGLGLLLTGSAIFGAVTALAGVSIAQAGQQALLPDRIRPAWRGRASGMKNAFDLGGAFAAFLILSVLLGYGEIGAAVGVLATVLVASALVSWALLGADARAATHPAPDEALDVRRLVTLIAARFLFLLGIYAVGRFLLLFVADRFGLGADAAAGEAGLVLALLALVTVAGSVPSGWLTDRLGRRRVMLAGGSVAALGIGLLPLATSLPGVVGFGSLMAVGSAAFGSASWAMLGDLVRAGRAGALMGLANAGTAGAAAAAGLFGPVVDLGGYGQAFALAAASTLAGGVLAWTLVDMHGPSTDLVGSPEGAH